MGGIRTGTEGLASKIWCRVLVVEQGEGLWGAQRYLLRLAPLLEERGVEQILAAPAESAIYEAWGAEGRPRVALPVPARRTLRDETTGRPTPGRMARELARTVRLAGQTAVLARRTHVDVIHANSHWSHMEGAMAAFLARRPAELHLHEESERDVVGKLRGLAVMMSAESVAVSGAVAQSLPKMAARRTKIIRNGVDTDELCPGPLDLETRREVAEDPAAPLVLVLSRLDPRKGVSDVIRAVAALPAELGHAQLAVAGASSLDPGHGDELRELGAELLGTRIRFLGPRRDVANLLRAADVLVLASTLEGLPLSVLEAQACGCAVVAYPTAGIPEVVTDGVTGLLARPGEIDDLTKRIAEVLSDGELRRRLSMAGRKRVELESTLAGQADQQVALLRNLVAGRGPR